jgi:DNA-binding NarL/FixJ family response regulator
MAGFLDSRSESESDLVSVRDAVIVAARSRCAACGLPTPLSPGEITIETALRPVLPEQLTMALTLTGTLSEREREAFELLGLGYDNRSIANALILSERTVKRHITAILTKLRLESRLQAGLIALIKSCASARNSWPEGRIDRE